MNKLALLKLEFKNFLKLSKIPILIFIVILIIIIRNIQIPFEVFKENKNISTFLTLSILLAISYAGVFIFTFGFGRKKLNNIYHRYFISPTKPISLFFIELAPPFTLSLLGTISYGIFIYLKFHPVSLSIFIFIIIICLIFLIGVLMCFFSLNLILKNIQVISAIKFLLIFALSYFPNFVISKGYPVSILILGLSAFSAIIFLTGIILLIKINSEKVILS